MSHAPVIKAIFLDAKPPRLDDAPTWFDAKEKSLAVEAKSVGDKANCLAVMAQSIPMPRRIALSSHL
ncbi:hypothetical protein [Pseudoxanthomonas sp.]|uniref:hypothetical protein n=1 Tax=Pseudoxanthomonas sp. TaxID=1871049 RepID=UPI002E0F5280|nr:hypothetical protein [Pseudoxanthomonas sp.]